MNNELQVFKHEQFGEIRAINKEGEPWFIGKDIAEKLGYKRPAKAIQDKVDVDDKDVVPIQDSIGRNQKTPIINESGLYSLILSSKLPNAKKFKRWVTSEVLPTIRKHGAYMSNEVIEETLHNPDFIIQLATKLKHEKEENEKYRKTIQEQEPKVLLADKLTSSKGFIEMKVFAKLLDIPHMGRTNFYKWLRDSKMLMEDNIPYQKYYDYFKVLKVQGKHGFWHNKTVVKPKGITYIIKRLLKDGYITVDEYKPLINKIKEDLKHQNVA